MGTSEKLQGIPLHRSTETENTNKNEGREKVQSDLLHDLPDLLQEFREKLVDESSPTEPLGHPASKDRDSSSSSHELPMVTSKSATGLRQAWCPHPLPERPKL